MVMITKKMVKGLAMVKKILKHLTSPLLTIKGTQEQRNTVQNSVFSLPLLEIETHQKKTNTVIAHHHYSYKDTFTFTNYPDKKI